MPIVCRRIVEWFRSCMCTAGLLSLAFFLPASANAQLTAKPNILFVLVDDWGWGDIGVQGGSIPTLNIDSLAKEGLRLTNYNVEHQSAPTRSAIHTARLPIRSGIRQTVTDKASGLAPWERTLAELLSEAGYDTALFGAWHLGDDRGRLPTDQGYDQWFGIQYGARQAAYAATPQFDATVFPVPHVWEGKKGEAATQVMPFDLEVRGRIDRMIVERSIDYIKQHTASEVPFFLFIGLTDLSPPWSVHPYFKGRSGSGIYSDTLMQLDHHVGVLLQALEDAALSADTIVVLTGDNGGLPAVAGGGSNGPFRGGFTGYEGGLRTVGMIRWPGRIRPGRVSDQIFAALDWMPTLTSLIGESDRMPSDRPIDGIDQSAFVRGEQDTADRQHVVFYIGEALFSFKWRQFKVHFKTMENYFAPIREHAHPLIYDVRNDPAEQVELLQSQGFAHLWVMTPVRKILGQLAASMQRYPNIRPGMDFKGYD